MKKHYRFLVLMLLICLILTVTVFAVAEAGAEPIYETDVAPSVANAGTVSTLDTDTFGFAPVMAITVICYLVAAALKATPLDNKWLPVICGFCGAILGVLAMYIGMQGFPATDWLTAVAIGIVSGLAATGVNQIGKQLGKTE